MPPPPPSPAPAGGAPRLVLKSAEQNNVSVPEGTGAPRVQLPRTTVLVPKSPKTPAAMPSVAPAAPDEPVKAVPIVSPVQSRGVDEADEEASEETSLPKPSRSLAFYDVDDDRKKINLEVAAKVLRGVKWGFRGALLLLLAWAGYWAWGYWFDPAGRLAWQQKMPMGELHIIDSSEGKLTFLNGECVYRITAEDGNVEKLSETPALRKYATGVKFPLGKSGMLFGHENSLLKFEFPGTEKWEHEFDDGIVRIQPGRDAVLVVTAKQEEKPGARNPFDVTTTFKRFVLAMDDGRILQEKTFPKDQYPPDEQAVGAYLLRFEEEKSDGDSQMRKMVVADFASGRELWHLTTPGNFTWGPAAIGDQLIFQLKKTLHSLNLADGGKRWNLKVDGEFVGTPQGDEPDHAFFSDGRELALIDLAAGHEKWRVPLPEGAQFADATAERVYLQGVTEETIDNEEEVKLPDAYEKLAREEVLVREMLKRPKRNVIEKRYLVCLDAATGKELWTQPEVRGELVIGGSRAVILWDTANRGALAVLNTRNLGDTVIEQLSARSGKYYFKRSDPIGLSGPMIICGDALVAPYYLRGGSSREPSGFAGFLLKE